MKVSTIFKVIVPLLFLFGGMSVMNWLIDTRPKAEVKKPPEPVTLVAVQQATPGSQKVMVHGAGTVVAARSVVIQPEVTGRVTVMNGNLVNGGRLKAGESLITIDDRDYKLQVSQQSAQIASAKAQLRIEKGRKRVAEREWKILGTKGASSEGKALALREPQIAAAKASVRGAQVAMRRARLMASKTDIKVPFNAIVDTESVELDQLVGPTSRLATLIGTDQYWVEVALPVDKLEWISIPGVSTAAEKGSKATVTLDLGRGPVLTRTGYVVRLKPSLDPAGRMARVVVAIDNPLGLKEDGTTEGVPLLTGSYVKIAIEGSELPNVVELPRLALREGKEVWTMNDQSRLAVKPVEVRWRLKDKVLVSGITSGDKIITSLVPGMVPNMKLALDTPAPPAKTAAKASGKESDADAKKEVTQ